jgi:Fe-S cluster assembly protein SufB
VGGDLKSIVWDNIHYYLKPVDKAYQSWDEVPDSVRKVFDAIGVPEAEKSMLAGVGGQYDSEVIYHSLQETLAKKGVVFLSMDEGLKQYPAIVKEYFGKTVPYGDNKLAALNTAVWSGGSFVYIPKGVVVDLPLQSYFRINAENAGQFERTLIIAEEGSSVHYVEGCSAPAYSSASLHSAVVEVVVKAGAKVRYTTIQNWYKTVYNLVTKRRCGYRWPHGVVDCTWDQS